MAKSNLPPVLTIKRGNFEDAFKTIMLKMVSENKLEMEDLRGVNKQMVKWLITGMQNIDFEKDIQNKYNLDRLVDDLWTDFFKSLNKNIRKHRIKFRRK